MIHAWSSTLLRREALATPGLGETIGHGSLLAGNAVAGITMAVILRRELAA